MSAKDYWNEIYQKNPYPSGKAPHSFLVEALPRLQKGKALDVAMGDGANAVYLAQKGFQVKGFDIAPQAVESARKLAQESGVSVDAKTTDLDMYLMGIMEYDTILMTQFRPVLPRYYSELTRALKQGGTLLIASHTTQEMKEAIPKDEGYRNHFFNSNELLKNLSHLKILYYNEGEVDGHHIVHCLAQKPLDKDAAKYKLFDMHTSQSENIKSKHMELAEKLFKNS